MTRERWLAEEHLPELATHEAGHAVMDVLLETGVEEIEILEADDGTGLYDGSCTPGAISAASHEAAMVEAAGLVAESFRRRETPEQCLAWIRGRLDPARSDFHDGCDEDGLLRAIREDAVDLERVVLDARLVLSERWPEVEAVASALLAKWSPGAARLRLDAAEIAEAMQAARSASSARAGRA